jgi:hypothetical protein
LGFGIPFAALVALSHRRVRTRKSNLCFILIILHPSYIAYGTSAIFTTHTKAPITQSDMLVASSAANPVAKPPQDPVSSVDSLSKDLHALESQGSGTETCSALPSAQHVGDKIASILESAAVPSAPIPEDVSTANPAVSRSARSSQAPHSVNRLHVSSGFHDPDSSKDATV